MKPMYPLVKFSLDKYGVVLFYRSQLSMSNTV